MRQCTRRNPWPLLKQDGAMQYDSLTAMLRDFTKQNSRWEDDVPTRCFPILLANQRQQSQYHIMRTDLWKANVSAEICFRYGVQAGSIVMLFWILVMEESLANEKGSALDVAFGENPIYDCRIWSHLYHFINNFVEEFNFRLPALFCLCCNQHCHPNDRSVKLKHDDHFDPLRASFFG